MQNHIHDLFYNTPFYVHSRQIADEAHVAHAKVRKNIKRLVALDKIFEPLEKKLVNPDAKSANNTFKAYVFEGDEWIEDVNIIRASVGLSLLNADDTKTSEPTEQQELPRAINETFGTSLEEAKGDRLIQQNDDIPSINSLEIAELTDVRHDSVRRTIENTMMPHFLARPQVVDDVKKFNNSNGLRTQKIYVFKGEAGKTDSIALVAQLSPAFTARLVRRWEALEKENRQLKDTIQNTPAVPPQLPDFTNPVMAARAWADAIEKQQVLTVERDEAVRSRGRISRSREAKALSQTGVLTKRCKKLEGEVKQLKEAIKTAHKGGTVIVSHDLTGEYVTIKEAAIQYRGRHFRWEDLKRATFELGLKIKKVDDPNYLTVNAYHIEAWMHAYGIRPAPLKKN